MSAHYRFLSESGIVYRGVCKNSVGSTTSIIVPMLSGYGDDFFTPTGGAVMSYQMLILHNENSAGNAPQGQLRAITDYESATGTFTCTAFGAAVEDGDLLLILSTLLTAAGGGDVAAVLAMLTDVHGTDLPAVKTDTAAIKLKTDNLPASPAATGAAMTLTAAYDAAKTAAQPGTAMTLTAAYDAAKTAAQPGADADTLKTLSDQLDTVVTDLQVPTADVATNTYERDVIGNKSDAVKITAGQSSIVSLLRDLIAAIGVVGTGAGSGYEIDGAPSLAKAVSGNFSATWADGTTAQRSLLDMPYIMAACTSPEDCVIDGPNNVKFKMEITNLRTAAAVVASGAITPGTITIYRFRPGYDTDFTAIVTAAACIANNGFVSYNYTFPSASWQSGDIYSAVITGVVVTLQGQTTYIPNYRMFGTVASSATVDDVYGKDHPVLKSVFNTTVTTKNASVTLVNLTSPDRALKDIAVEFYLDSDVAATFTPEWYVSRTSDPGTLVVRILPAVETIVTPAAVARYRYTYGDLPAGVQLEFRVAQDNAGDATNVIESVCTYME